MKGRGLALVLVVAGLVLCIFMSFGPALLKDNMIGAGSFGVEKPKTGTARAVNILVGTFAFLIGIVAVFVIVAAAFAKDESVIIRDIDRIAKEEEFKAMRRELDAYRLLDRGKR